MITQILLANTEESVSNIDKLAETITDQYRTKCSLTRSKVQRGTQLLEGKHTLAKASAEFPWTGSTSPSIADFIHEQSFSQILHGSNKLRTEN